jgi:glutamate racemase
MSVTANDLIGVFDSGVGGLTVYRALREALPHENFVYLGDTARLPYGVRSADIVAQYTLEAAHFLQKQKIKLLVIACHTVSALALPALHEKVPELACLGVVAPTLEAAITASRTGHIAVLATEGTVKSNIYPEMIRALKPGAEAETLACGDLVTLAEAGKWEGPETEAAIKRYLGMLKSGFDTLVLGCTHFPLLASAIRKLIPADTALIDSAAATARVVSEILHTRNLANPQNAAGTSRFLATAAPEHFALLAQRFLNKTITADLAVIDGTQPI